MLAGLRMGDLWKVRTVWEANELRLHATDPEDRVVRVCDSRRRNRVLQKQSRDQTPEHSCISSDHITAFCSSECIG